MGMIADEFEYSLMNLQAVLSINLPIMVNGNTLSCPAGPVMGMAFVQAEPIYAQMSEIAKAMQSIPKVIRKLEDRIKKLEDVPPVRPQPFVPQGFRR